MSKTDFESVREGRHYLRNHLSVVAAFVYIANNEDEENPTVSALWEKAQKIAEALAGGEGKEKADQVLALSETVDLFKEAAAEQKGEVKKILTGLSKSAQALAKFASDRDFEAHQKQKEAERAEALKNSPFAALFSAGELGDDELDLDGSGDAAGDVSNEDNPNDW